MAGPWSSPSYANGNGLLIRVGQGREKPSLAGRPRVPGARATAGRLARAIAHALGLLDRFLVQPALFDPLGPSRANSLRRDPAADRSDFLADDFVGIALLGLRCGLRKCRCGGETCCCNDAEEGPKCAHGGFP